MKTPQANAEFTQLGTPVMGGSLRQLAQPIPTPGPWEVGEFKCSRGRNHLAIGNERMDKSCPVAIFSEINQTNSYDRENAKLCAAAPAMKLALTMLTIGIARIERSGSLCEFCFNGIRYIMNDDWNGLMGVIGWDKAVAAIGGAAGKAETNDTGLPASATFRTSDIARILEDEAQQNAVLWRDCFDDHRARLPFGLTITIHLAPGELAPLEVKAGNTIIRRDADGNDISRHRATVWALGGELLSSEKQSDGSTIAVYRVTTF